MKIKTLYKIAQNQGLKYILFRSFYEFRKKAGLLEKKFPTNSHKKDFISLEEWKKASIPFLFTSKSQISLPKNRSKSLEDRWLKIISGKIQYFNRTWENAKDWHTNIESNYTYEKNLHWTKIKDIATEAGDIKYVWEKSRFSYIYDAIRYDYHFEKNQSSFVISEICNWIDENPINLGPNYVCSQEISLRCLNWVFAIHYYKHSNSLTQEIFSKIINSIYRQVQHVYSNIHFSRICVRNNHAITETMMIYFAGLLFPFFEEAEKWKNEGKRWLEEEINYQIYDDGTYLQFSHNYQRVLCQLLTWTISMSKIYNDPLDEQVLSKSQKVVQYMSNCCIGINGELPNYGSNDGALFFNLNDCDYTDFRPTINALNFVITGKHLYDESKLQEDAFWYSQHELQFNSTPIVNRFSSINSFDEGGIYTIKDDHSFTFFKCASYKDRPAHADNMHLDLWVDGLNILRDSGTYKYNTSIELINYFAGTMGHNSLMIDNENQMIKGPRFIWFDWTRYTKVDIEKSDDFFTISAEARMFPSLGNNIIHKRTIKKYAGLHHWDVCDVVQNLPKNSLINQLWHPNPKALDKLNITAYDKLDNSIPVMKSEGYWSAYYGDKQEVPVLKFASDSNVINTSIKYNP